jgi:hypothetical protein
MTSSFSLGVVPAFATCTAHTLLVFAMQSVLSPQLMNESGQTVPRSYSFFDDMKDFSKGERNVVIADCWGIGACNRN